MESYGPTGVRSSVRQSSILGGHTSPYSRPNGLKIEAADKQRAIDGNRGVDAACSHPSQKPSVGFILPPAVETNPVHTPFSGTSDTRPAKPQGKPMIGRLWQLSAEGLWSWLGFGRYRGSLGTSLVVSVGSRVLATRLAMMILARGPDLSEFGDGVPGRFEAKGKTGSDKCRSGRGQRFAYCREKLGLLIPLALTRICKTAEAPSCPVGLGNARRLDVFREPFAGSAAAACACIISLHTAPRMTSRRSFEKYSGMGKSIISRSSVRQSEQEL